MTGTSDDSLRGVIAPLLTPFNDDLSVAHDLLVSHSKAMLEAGCVGLTPFGTTGEGPSISRAERTNALWHMTQAGIDPQVIIPGTGLLNFHATAALSRACLDMNCAGVMVLPPYYFKNVRDDGLFAYFSRVIEAVGEDMRMFLYHIPQVAVVGLSIPLVQRLKTAFPQQVVGIKDSSGDLENAKALLRIEGLQVYLGNETLLPDLLSLNPRGTITAAANLNAGPVSEYVSALQGGDAMGSEYMRDAILAARTAMISRDLIPTPKRVLAMRTGDERWANVRPPLMPAPAAAGEALETALSDLA